MKPQNMAVAESEFSQAISSIFVCHFDTNNGVYIQFHFFYRNLKITWMEFYCIVKSNFKIVPRATFLLSNVVAT